MWGVDNCKILKSTSSNAYVDMCFNFVYYPDMVNNIRREVCMKATRLVSVPRS